MKLPDTLPRFIEARGVRHNTLRDLDVDIPLWHTVVIAGVSGSGKTSLAMGTLYAEGLHRFLEGLSTYSRRRLTQAQRPDADRIDHLPPALALRQRPPVPGPRSTVGTMSEVLNVLRLTMSRLGTHRCPNGHDVPPSIETQAMEISCPTCGVRFEAPGAESFAFNSYGACPRCDGIGTVHEVDQATLVPDPGKTIAEGAVLPWNVGGRRLSMYAAGELGVRLDVPYGELSRRERELVMSGEPVKQLVVVSGKNGRPVQLNVTYDNAVTAALKSDKSRFLSTQVCPLCEGSRLNAAALASRLDGRNLASISSLGLADLADFAGGLAALMPSSLSRLTAGLVGELTGAVQPLLDLGLGYLALDRAGGTLSTGERQRIELTSTVRSNTTGMLYVLDEPSVGLHPSNVEGLRKTIGALAANGNSVVIVEHDLDVIRTADWIIEMGPGAGRLGGTVVATGTPAAIMSSRASIIGPYLAGRASVGRELRALPDSRVTLTVKNLYNLRDVTARFPIGRLTGVAGPSGAGKTALVLDSLVPAARARLAGAVLPAHVQSLDLGPLRQVVEIDATPIGLNARSTPSTYSGAFDAIRAHFAAHSRLGAGHFSFNTKDGQCPTCTGLGSIDLDVQYLPDINVECPTCHGARYNEQTLAVRVDDLTIADVLGLTVREALDRYATVPAIARPLRPIVDVGLDYLRLGEPTPALSGGESQRLRIAARLRSSQRDVLYVLDEPSTGLHPVDIGTLVRVFDRLLDDGATIVVIDHDLDVLAASDHVIDMGPTGGPEGGRIVAEGRPAAVATDPNSVTGPYLAAHLPPVDRA
ncbi:excinuclease ABC subunit A [Paractinoplanes abujensis]|uniref:UvrABC system protein A n=1 Tax=Paractinoplanes abujensis TaxID=882441 RepID=A0A7W7CM63_9ACTN|nr:excinuclease ABC subunit UvrA [Actinoplanes abujensis]MBB4691110.1 excinuclease ABC subunit A [Actinoplanes abujensis]GID17477.1 excinuclease ABC subunit A [Actinoplanes abujensis]